MSVAREVLEEAGDTRGRPSFFGRLCRGLARSTGAISSGLTGIFTKRKLDEESLQDIEHLLLDADFGPSVARELVDKLRAEKFGKEEFSLTSVKESLGLFLGQILSPCEQSISVLEPKEKPFIIMLVGVNGVGKTTTAAKLAHHFLQEGRSVALVAADTFRAAAVEQLQIWGQRLSVPVFTTKEGGDSAALAFSSIEEARRQAIDVLIIDTAGRLHNKEHLMAELAKLTRVVQKCEPTAPHATLLVVDASIGQNTLQQVDVFAKLSGINGLIMTKLDGTAKGGILVSVAKKTPLPIVMLSFGENLEDIGFFKANEFARSLLSLS